MVFSDFKNVPVYLLKRICCKQAHMFKLMLLKGQLYLENHQFALPFNACVPSLQKFQLPLFSYFTCLLQQEEKQLPLSSMCLHSCSISLYKTDPLNSPGFRLIILPFPYTKTLPSKKVWEGGRKENRFFPKSFKKEIL